MADSITAIQGAAEEAGVGGLLVGRWLGAWIDLLVLTALFFVPTLAARSLGVFDQQATNYLIIGSLFICALYFPLLEGLWGRSIGKFVSGLRVVDKNGRAPGLGRALVRTVFRLIEVNPLLAGGVPAGLVVLFTKRKQRIGDLIAGTYVLRASSLRQMRDVDATLAARRASS